MRSLTLRIYFTVLAALALFALVSSMFMERQMTQQRETMLASVQERASAWAELLERSLPGADAPVEQQAAALVDWANRLRLPLALDDASGTRIGASEAYLWREAGAPEGLRRGQSIRLFDGRTLWIMRPQPLRGGPGSGPGPLLPRHGPPLLPWGLGTAAQSLLIFAAIALGAWPVVRRLTRRLEALKQGVDDFGAGELNRRVAEDGKDEVAALGASFNRAAARIEALLLSHRSLLANASHELRSPLARLKMAVSMIEDAPANLSSAQRDALQREIHANIGELDALVEEVLLASRLQADAAPQRTDPVDLLALAAEETARFDAAAEGEAPPVVGDERLLRRALRNLLENAQRYGGGVLGVRVQRGANGAAEVCVCDRGPGVPEAYRERIFEPFFRLPGHAEHEGGVGLGLALVRQIALAHGGSVRCEPREGGGSCFRLSLPAA